MIIGLTGKSCAGKDRFASLLDERFLVIDEDGIGHDALEELKDKLAAEFGASIIGKDGKFDRKILGPIVFSSPEKLEKLDSITHPWMVERTLEIAHQAEKDGRIAVINAALLEKMGFVKHCDQVVLVQADYSVREKRALSRDGATPESFRKRCDSQKEIGLSLFASGKKVVTILNNGSDEALSRQVSYYCDTLK